MTWRGGVVTSVGGEAIPRRKKGGNDAGWADVNLTEPKMKKIHAVDSIVKIEQ
jgi:hypothetical protein